MIAVCLTDDCDGTNCACDCHDNTEDTTMSIFEHLEHEWHDAGQHVSDWFRHHGDTITTDPHQPHHPQETTVSVPDAVAALKTNLEAATTSLAAALNDDVPGLENIGTQIDDSRLIQASVAADAVVPQAILDAEAAALEALTAAFTTATAPEAPAEPVQQVN